MSDLSDALRDAAQAARSAMGDNTTLNAVTAGAGMAERLISGAADERVAAERRANTAERDRDQAIHDKDEAIAAEQRVRNMESQLRTEFPDTDEHDIVNLAAELTSGDQGRVRTAFDTLATWRDTATTAAKQEVRDTRHEAEMLVNVAGESVDRTQRTELVDTIAPWLDAFNEHGSVTIGGRTITDRADLYSAIMTEVGNKRLESETGRDAIIRGFGVTDPLMIQVLDTYLKRVGIQNIHQAAASLSEIMRIYGEDAGRRGSELAAALGLTSAEQRLLTSSLERGGHPQIGQVGAGQRRLESVRREYSAALDAVRSATTWEGFRAAYDALHRLQTNPEISAARQGVERFHRAEMPGLLTILEGYRTSTQVDAAADLVDGGATGAVHDALNQVGRYVTLARARLAATTAAPMLPADLAELNTLESSGLQSALNTLEHGQTRLLEALRTDRRLTPAQLTTSFNQLLALRRVADELEIHVAQGAAGTYGISQLEGQLREEIQTKATGFQGAAATKLQGMTPTELSIQMEGTRDSHALLDRFVNARGQYPPRRSGPEYERNVATALSVIDWLDRQGADSSVIATLLAPEAYTQHTDTAFERFRAGDERLPSQDRQELLNEARHMLSTIPQDQLAFIMSEAYLRRTRYSYLNAGTAVNDAITTIEGLNRAHRTPETEEAVRLLRRLDTGTRTGDQRDDSYGDEAIRQLRQVAERTAPGHALDEIVRVITALEGAKDPNPTERSTHADWYNILAGSARELQALHAELEAARALPLNDATRGARIAATIGLMRPLVGLLTLSQNEQSERPGRISRDHQGHMRTQLITQAIMATDSYSLTLARRLIGPPPIPAGSPEHTELTEEIARLTTLTTELRAFNTQNYDDLTTNRRFGQRLPFGAGFFDRRRQRRRATSAVSPTPIPRR